MFYDHYLQTKGFSRATANQLIFSAIFETRFGSSYHCIPDIGRITYSTIVSQTQIERSGLSREIYRTILLEKYLRLGECAIKFLRKNIYIYLRHNLDERGMMYACENRICTLQHDATIKESYIITTITRELLGPSCVNRLRVTAWKNSPVRFKTTG